MLTDEAYLARKWRNRSLLGTVLEGRTVAGDELLASIQQTTGEHAGDLIVVGRLAVEHGEDVAKLALTHNPEAVHQEVEQLACDIMDLSRFLADLADQIQSLHPSIEQCAHRKSVDVVE